jgi:hypothetical protein
VDAGRELRPIVRIAALVWLALAGADAQQRAGPQQAAPAEAAAAPVRVQTRISQTAAWTGDPLIYSVRLELAPRVELPEDLSGEALSWAPFRRLGFEQIEEVHPDGSRAVTLLYRLVPVDLPERGFAQVPPLRVAYVRLPDRPVPRDELPAEELVVEGPRIALRSTLDVAPEAATIRDGKELLGRDLSGRTLVVIGLAGLLLGAVPFARSAQLAVRRLVERRRAAAARGARRDGRQQVAALRNAPLGGPADYERLYGGLFEALRDHLADEYDVTFPGLTSVDADALRRAGVNGEVADRIVDFLRECEIVRYRPDLPDDAEQRARQAVALVERVMAA